VCSNFPSKVHGLEERAEIEGLGHPILPKSRTAGVQWHRRRSCWGRTGWGPGTQDTDVSDGWEPPVELRNGLANKKKEKLCVSRGKRTQSGRQTLLK